MSKNKLQIIGIVTIIIVSVSCKENRVFQENAYYLGAPLIIKVYDCCSDTTAQNLIAAVYQEVKTIEETMTTSTKDYDTSVLIDINRRSAAALLQTAIQSQSSDSKKQANSQQVQILSFEITDAIYQVLTTGLKIATLTKGAFDPTIAPIVNSWGFGSEREARPLRNQVESLLPLVDYTSLTVAKQTSSGDSTITQTKKLPNKLTKNSTVRMAAGQQLDVGGVAKGYAADRAAAIIREAGVKSALIDFGGNIFALGTKQDGSAWRIGLQSPFDSIGILAGALSVVDSAVVTSGTYERFFVEADIAYHHILDPKTGWQVDNDLLSVTIVAPNSTYADALSTGVFVLGLIEGMALIESLSYAEVIFIDNEKKVYLSSGLTSDFVITNDEYRLADLPIK